MANGINFPTGVPAIDASNADSGNPEQPYNGPMAPAGQGGAPDAPELGAPGTPNTSMGAAFARAGIQPTAPKNSDGSQSDLVNSMADKANAAAKVNPNPNAPGAWAKNLLAGVMGSLGDAAAAGENVKSGSGWLGGVEKTMAARTDRLAKQKQQQFDNDLKMSKEQREAKNDEATRALTAAQTIHAQKSAGLVESQTKHSDAETADLAQKVSTDHINTGKSTVDLFRKNHTVQDGIDESTLKQMMDAYQKSPTPGPDGRPQGFQDKYSVFQTGSQDVSQPDGSTHSQPIYSLVTKSANPVKVDAATADFIKKNGGANVQVDTDMPGDLLDSQVTQAMQVAQSRQLMEGFQQKELDLANDKNLTQAMQNTSSLMAQNVSDPFAGLAQGLKNAKAHEAQLNVLLNNAKKQGDAEGVQKYQGQLQQIKKEESDINTVVNSPKLAAAREKHYEIIEKARLKAEEKATEKGEINGARLAEGLDWPSDLSKRSKDLEERKDAADKYSIAKYGHPVNWGQLDNDHKYASAKSTQDVLGLVAGVGEPGGSLDIALKAAQGLPNVSDSQTLNKVFSKGGGEFGDKAVTDFHTAMYGLADEYAKIMGGGSASLGAFDHAMALLKDGYTKGQMDSAATVLRKDMDARKRGIIGNNIFLIRKYADNPEDRATSVLQGKDPWAAEKAAGAYNANGAVGTQQSTAPVKGATQTYNNAQYTFDGTKWVKN